MADLRLDRVGKSFGPTTAVRELSLDIASGEFIVLLGPSGAGKTTTLRLVAGLETPDRGRVFIGGEDVTRPRRRCATSPSCSSSTRSIRT
jgi:multiple sugar transport system ATP-binding protein